MRPFAPDEPKPHVPGRCVYIGLRVYSPDTLSRVKNCKGLNIRAFDFTPEEVHQIILDALRAAAERAQLIARGQEQLNGTSDPRQPR
jgi:hypothetical protein